MTFADSPTPVLKIAIASFCLDQYFLSAFAPFPLGVLKILEGYIWVLFSIIFREYFQDRHDIFLLSHSYFVIFQEWDFWREKTSEE